MRVAVSLCFVLVGCTLFSKTNTTTLSISGVCFRYIAEPKGEDNWQGVPYTLRRGGGDCEDGAAVEAVAASAKGQPAWILWLGHYIDYKLDPKTHVFGISGATHLVAVTKTPDGRYQSSGVNGCDNVEADSIDEIARKLARFYRANFYQLDEVTTEVRAIFERDSHNVDSELKKVGIRYDYYRFVFLDPDLEKMRQAHLEERKKRGKK